MKTLTSRWGLQATFSLLSAWACLGHATGSPHTVPTAGKCVVDQEQALPQMHSSDGAGRSMSFGRCGTERYLWLSDPKKSADAPPLPGALQAIKLPALKPGETYDIAVGACVSKGKTIMEPLFIHAKWGRRKEIRYNKGLLKVWMYDAKKDTLIERKASADLYCEADTP